MTAFKPRNNDFEACVRESFARQDFMTHIGAAITRIVPGEVDIELPHNWKLMLQHGFFHAATIKNQPSARRCLASSKYHRFFHRHCALRSITDVTKTRIVFLDVVVDRPGLVELPLTFIVQCEVVQQFKCGFVHGQIAELVESHVQLSLALQ